MRVNKYIPIILFLYAFSIRFAFRSAGLLHVDSAVYASLGELTFRTQSIHYAQFPGHPGVVLINAAFYGLFQLFGYDSEFTTIFVSVLFGAAAAPMIYLICTKLGFSNNYAMYAGLIMIFYPLQWSLSEYLPTDVEALFFLLAAIYFVLAAKRHSLYAGSLMFLASIAIKLENIFLLPFYIGLCILCMHHLKERSGSWIIVLREIILVMLILVFGIFLLYGPYMPDARDAIDDPVRIVSVQFKTLSWQLMDAFNLLKLTFSSAGIILVILGAAGIFLRRTKIGSYERIRGIMLVLLFLSFFIIFFSASIPLKDYERYILSGFSLLIIFMTCGLKVLGDMDRRIPVILVISLVIYMVYITLPIVSARHAWSGQKDFALSLKDMVGKDAIIVAIDEGKLINYYTNLTIIYPDVDRVEKLLGENRSIYFVDSITGYPSGQEFIIKGMERFNFIKLNGFYNEDWHGRVLKRKIFTEHVYRIVRK